MGKTIKIDINEEAFETSEPFEAFAFATAVHHYGYDSGLAQEIAKLCYTIYTDIQAYFVNTEALFDVVLRNYHDLPNDYNEILNRVSEHSLELQGLL